NKLLESFLIHEMTPFGIVVKKGRGHRLDIRLCKLLTRTKTLFHDRARQHVTQTRAHHRCAASCRRRSEENVEDQVRLPVNRDQHFTFEFIRSLKRHSGSTSQDLEFDCSTVKRFRELSARHTSPIPPPTRA